MKFFTLQEIANMFQTGGKVYGKGGQGVVMSIDEIVNFTNVMVKLEYYDHIAGLSNRHLSFSQFLSQYGNELVCKYGYDKTAVAGEIENMKMLAYNQVPNTTLYTS